MVEHHQQHAGRAVHLLERLEDLGSARGGEDVAYHADIEHAFADESAQGGFMARATQGDDGHLALILGLGPAHQLIGHQLHLVAVGKHVALQQLFGEIFRVIDELFHGHERSLGLGVRRKRHPGARSGLGSMPVLAKTFFPAPIYR